MALDSTKWQVRADKAIRYIGGDHGTSTANYVTVLELYRWLMDLADDDEMANDDYMDIVTLNPSSKQFDTIITLINGYTLDDSYTTPASEFIYAGSIIQGTGGTEVIYDGIKIVANAGITVNVIQDEAPLTNDYWNSVPDGSKTAITATVSAGSSGTTVECTDTSELAAGDYVMFGTVVDEVYLIDSITDSNTFEVTETLVTTPSASDAIYIATKGINADSSVGVAMQFMVKVRDSGADIDNRALIFNTREWFSSYSEFRVPATGRGENTVPLLYTVDLNNTTPLATVATWTTITNVTAGYNAIDVNQDSTDEYYYSEWNRDTYSINQFYERMKYITRAGETSTLYGLPGEEFRGITHAFTLAAAPSPGSWTEGAAINWDSAASTGQLLAYDTASDIAYIQLTSGVVPGDSETLTDGTNTADTAASNSVAQKAVSSPFCGASTGSSIVGAYGFALEYADMAVNDKFTALDGVTRQPPNNVTFTLGGIQSSWRVLVGPEDGASGLDYDQLSSTNNVTSAGVTSIVVDEALPANTPTSAGTTGGIRIQRDDGNYTLHRYTAVSESPTTFTIPSTDFDTNGITAGANIFITYIDKTSTGTTEQYNTVQTTTQTLYCEARYGGTGPSYTDSIKPASTTGTLGSTGGSATISSINDA